jgi:hypothetical protein
VNPAEVTGIADASGVADASGGVEAPASTNSVTLLANLPTPPAGFQVVNDVPEATGIPVMNDPSLDINALLKGYGINF